MNLYDSKEVDTEEDAARYQRQPLVFESALTDKSGARHAEKMRVVAAQIEETSNPTSLKALAHQCRGEATELEYLLAVHRARTRLFEIHWTDACEGWLLLQSRAELLLKSRASDLRKHARRATDGFGPRMLRAHAVLPWLGVILFALGCAIVVYGPLL